MPKLYLISGLGADWRMFQFLRLPPHLPYQHVEWLAPAGLNEPISAYAQRLVTQHQIEPGSMLLGLSYGGLVAIEVAKLIPVQKVMLLSSLDSRHGLPWYYRALGNIRLHQWLPFTLLKAMHPLAHLLFGAHTPVEKQLLKEVILEIDELFLRWSLGQVLTWTQEQPPPNLVHIHGTHDRILPLHDRPDVIQVKNGGHLMVMHQADEISLILAQILNDLHHHDR